MQRPKNKLICMMHAQACRFFRVPGNITPKYFVQYAHALHYFAEAISAAPAAWAIYIVSFYHQNIERLGTRMNLLRFTSPP